MSGENSSPVGFAEAILWHGLLLVALMLILSSCESSGGGELSAQESTVLHEIMLGRPCDEIYVVREGETLQTISDKCGDPYIVEENPHIHDPDDVFPGLVIKITTSRDTPLKVN
ncbi:uncharacterized protein LOC142550771 [Primulina tabacum]|uniref:uncharacterized protein LOC142550771 n=1 Tax=Primulina tabacum TaxID=48773 RepID=UPI003F5A5CAE